MLKPHIFQNEDTSGFLVPQPGPFLCFRFFFSKENFVEQVALIDKRASGVAGPTGIEPAAYGLRVRRSNLTELRAQSFL